ncbi:MAG: hypothetical protein J07AB43_07980 [Candidatus Nanosalina sp. J07AB43]|nr:MAG: hypothetical protein J07AB43_07980 [Candidatus Nanosalina sp. J07AB43]
MRKEVPRTKIGDIANIGVTMEASDFL